MNLSTDLPAGPRGIAEIARRLKASGQWAALADHLADRAVLSGDPELILLRAEAALHNGDTHAAIELTNGLLATESFSAGPNRARLLLLRSTSLRLRGLLVEATEDASTALVILDRSHAPDARLSVETHKQLGILFAMRGELDAAIEHLGLAWRQCSLLGDLNLEAEVLMSLGNAHAKAGRLAEAQVQYRNALPAYEKIGKRAELATLHNNIGRLQYDLGRYREALDSFDRCLKIARQFRYSRTESMALVNVGDALRALGEHDEAFSAYRRALASATLAHEPRLNTCANIGVGATYGAVGEFEQARFHLAQARFEAHQSGLAWERADADLELGIVEIHAGRIDDAVHCLSTAIEEFHRLKSGPAVARAGIHLALALLRQGQTQDATVLLEESASMFRSRTGDRVHSADGIAIRELLDRMDRSTLPEEVTETFQASVQSTAAPSRARRPDNRPMTLDSARLEVRTLGGLQVRVDGRLVSRWESHKASELFVLLLCHPGGMTADQVIDTLWPTWDGEPPADMVHNAVYRARKAVGRGTIVFRHGLYMIGMREPVWFDLRRFQALSSTALRTAMSDTRRAELIQEANGLYLGEFLPTVHTEWVLEVRRSAETQFLANLSSLASIQIQLGDLNGAHATLDQILDVDPSDADASRRVVQILRARGDVPAARRLIALYEVRAREWGVPPSPGRGTRLKNDASGRGGPGDRD